MRPVYIFKCKVAEGDGKTEIFLWFERKPLESCEVLIGKIPVPEDIIKKTEPIYRGRQNPAYMTGEDIVKDSEIRSFLEDACKHSDMKLLQEFWAKTWQTINNLYL